MQQSKFTYSVLVGKSRQIGMYSNLKYAKENAKIEGGKVIRFKNNEDGSVTVFPANYVTLRGKI